jgi:ankyrin repeat protein
MRPELFQALESCDLGLVRNLLARGADPNSIAGDHPFDPYWTPLKQAIDAISDGGPIEVIQLLLQAGASVNGLGLPGETTPLLRAVGLQLYDVVKVLLTYHAGCALQNNMGDSPLISSVEDNDMTMAKLLLDHDATAVINNWGGPGAMTPLGWTAFKLNLPMMDLLLNAGADPNATDGDCLKAWERLPPRESVDSRLWDLAAERLGRPR